MVEITILLGVIGILLTIIVTFTFYEIQRRQSIKQLNYQKEQFEAILLIIRATLEKMSIVEMNSQRTEYIEKSVAGVSETFRSLNQIDQLTGKKVLWVDDHPEWNHYERIAFEVLGIGITCSLSTDDALAQLKTGNIDLIISDVFSDVGIAKGFELLHKVKAINSQIPVVFYTGHVTDELADEAKKLGAYGIEDIPARLSGTVLKVLLKI
ncbi:CheY-like chemotaxis protein [Methanomicrobium sp. W14]|uniref:response regulator n=1 Tax=Methanomicrobium sp. W14 TaxID=2817839 RepID=UPI001AE43425|nr:response regulator [Methanomicrobium sp. W14]MBP2132419.1 CheY-like chemotaxis protein [Methanomicrobium sp. W14]